jgi:hypothetical protein
MNTSTPNPQYHELSILDTSFNQDQGCFAIGHDLGFLVFNTNPIELRVQRTFASTTGSGIGVVRMLHRTNYLALVGGGSNPKFPNNKLVIWDDLKRKNSLNLQFPTPILNVLLSRIRIIVILTNQVIVYGFSTPPKKLAAYDTIDNDFGLADLSVNTSNLSSSLLQRPVSSSSPSSFTSSSNSPSPSPSLNESDSNIKFQTLAFPGRQIGQIQLVDVSPHGQEKNIVSIIKAHKSKIRALALNRAGTLIASASETGTLIRIHFTQSTALLYEFRRGIDKAVITSMKFSHNDSRLAVLSDKNTLHVYNIPIGNTNEVAVNRQHILKRIGLPIPIPNYFNSTWSFCSVNTNKYHTDSDALINDEGVLGWSGNDSIIIVWKQRRIWEKYTIVAKSTSTSHTFEDSNTTNNTNVTWEINRTSWKSLDSLMS